MRRIPKFVEVFRFQATAYKRKSKCLTQIGKCCPNGAETCNGSACCESGAVCCGGGECCAPEAICCDGGDVCCSADRTCCGGGCCDSGDKCCDGGKACCKPDAPCCGDTCCDVGGTCCPKDICCDEGETCCGEVCCLEGAQCCEGGDLCCEDDATCCGEVCCPDGTKCCDSWCEQNLARFYFASSTYILYSLGCLEGFDCGDATGTCNPRKPPTTFVVIGSSRYYISSNAHSDFHLFPRLDRQGTLYLPFAMHKYTRSHVVLEDGY